MKVWAYERCVCKYETGYKVMSLHTSYESAEATMLKAKAKEQKFRADGYRVTEWIVQGESR
jgi:hypothetical protein